jgi:hypothetical protein
MAATVQRWNDFVTVLAAAAAVPTAPTKVPSANSYGLKSNLALNLKLLLIDNEAAMSNGVWSSLLRQKVSTSCAGTHPRWQAFASMMLHAHNVCTPHFQLPATYLLCLRPSKSVNSSAEVPVYA